MLRTTDNASPGIPSPFLFLSLSLSIVARSSARLWKLITHQCALLIRLRAVIIGSWISYYGTKRQQNSPPHKIGHPYCPSLIRLLVISKAFIRCYVTERGELSVSLSSEESKCWSRMEKTYVESWTLFQLKIIFWACVVKQGEVKRILMNSWIGLVSRYYNMKVMYLILKAVTYIFFKIFVSRSRTFHK